MTVENKVTIITGGAQGIGLACGQRFARDGARVVLADIGDEKGEAAAEAIRSEGGDAVYVHCDVGDKSQVNALVESTVERHGRLDVMISNAAVLHIADILDLEEEDYDRVLRVNLKGFFLTGQAAARQMVAQGGGGSIINMSSIQAVITLPNILTYSICKGGVKSLTVSMALALADKGAAFAHAPGSVGRTLGDRVRRRLSRQRRVELHHRRDHLCRRGPARAQLHGAGSGLRRERSDAHGLVIR
jgi:NAD(P)-dependent dehydrogenase (short-subunit alcohol dehydrogenase family)